MPELHRITATPVLDRRGHIEGVVSEADLIRDLVQPDQRTHEWPGRHDTLDRPRVVGDVISTTRSPSARTPTWPPRSS